MPTADPSAKNVFLEALEFEQGEKRGAFLAQACGQDAALRKRVDALLAAHEEPDSRLDKPAMAQNTELFKPIKEGPGTLVGSYKLLQQIGEGGFGVVYMAEQQEPVRRMVALKIIKPGMDSKEVVARFEAERQALALMDHPNIARVLDAGTTDSGRPYFVMELVKGVPLTDYCDKNHLSTEQRLSLFVTVCHAVQHAHQKGVIHRDIKPSNVMVTLHDGHPVPKVIDFGVAKATNQRLTERTLFTAYGQMIGTPAYMSPEQAEMSGLDIDTRSDIYSLGVLLYELLTGSTPFDSRRLRDAGYLEMQRIIREEEPPRPSTRVSTLGEALTALSNQRSVDPKQFAETLRGDIDLIVMKALEKERNRRYDTPNSFAADIERYLHHEPVEARAPSALYRMRKFAQRNKTAVITGGLVAGAMVLATFVSSSLAVVANRESQRAIAAKKEADANLQQAIDNSQRALDSEAKAIASASSEREAKEAESRLRLSEEQRRLEIEALNSSLRKQKEDQRRIAYVGQMNLIQKAWDGNNFDRVRELLIATRPGPGETDLRGLEWHYWQRKIHPTENAVPLPEALAESQCRFSADGRWLACVPRYSGDNAKVLIVDVTNGATAFETTIALGPKPPDEELADGSTEWSQSVQVAHVDDRHIAIAVSNYQTKLGRDVSEKNLGGPTILKIIRRDTKETHFEANARSNYGFCQFVFSRDGNRVAAPLKVPLVKVWDVNTGTELHSISIPTDASIPRIGECLALNHEGTQIAIKPLLRLSQGVQPFGITLVDLATGRSVFTPSVSVSYMSYSMDSTRLFAFGPIISIFEPASGKKLASFDRGDIDQLPRDVSPDGKWLVVEKGQLNFVPGVTLPVHWLEIVDSSTGRVEATFKGFSGWVRDLAFSSDGRSLVTVLDQGIVTWPLPISQVDKPVDEDARSIVSPGGRWRVSVNPHVSSENQATEPGAKQSPRTLRLTDLKGQVENRDLPIQESLGVSLSVQFKFAPDGSFFAAVSTDPRGNLEQAGELKIWETDSGREILSRRVSVHAIRRNDETTFYPHVLAYKHIAFASGNRRVAVALPIDESINEASTESIRRSSDSLSGSVPGKSKVHVWDVKTGGGLRPLDVSIEMPHLSRVELSKIGNRLLILPYFSEFSTLASRTLAKSSPIECYDAQTGQRLWRHEISHLGLAITQDHSMIAAVVEGQGECNLIGWYSDDGRVAFRLPWSPEKSLSKAIQSDDRQCVAILSDSDVRIIEVASSKQRLVLDQSGGDVLDLALSKDGKRIITSFGSTALRRVGTFESARRRDLWPKGISIWDFQTGQELLTLSTPARGQPVWDYSYPIELDSQSMMLGNEVVFDVAPLKNKTLVRELTSATRDILFATNSSIDDDKRGLQFIQEAYDLEPSNVEVASLWALAHFRAEDARSVMQGILAKDGLNSKPDYPKSSEAYTLRALAMNYQGNRNKAMELLKQAQNTTSQDENLWLRLIREVKREMAIPLASSQPDQWIGHQFMPRQFKRDWILPLVATKVDGHRLQFGDVFLDSVEVVRLEDAVAYYTAGLETRSRDSEWWNYRGATRDSLGDFDQAIEDYTRAIELYQDLAYFVNRGNLLAEEKYQFEPAIADFKHALGIRSTDARAHASLARTYRKLGKLDEALESANEAIRFEASNGSHYCRRAYIHAATGKLDAMRDDFEKANALSSEDRRVWQQRAWLLATSTDDQHRNGPQAVLDATKACELTYWLDAESLDHLAAAYAETGDFAQAIQWQEKAIALTPIAKRPKLDSRLNLYKQHKPYREPLIRVQPAK